MGKCMGLFLSFRREPSPPALDVANDGLTAVVDVDVLDRDFLRSAGPVALQRLQLRGEGPRELIQGARPRPAVGWSRRD